MNLAKHVFAIAMTAFFAVTAAHSLQAQSASTDKVYDYTLVEKLPMFPGGKQAMTDYIQKNVVYPEGSRKFNIQGVVTVGFTLNAEGKVVATEVLSDPEFDNRLQKEAIKVVESMPAWSPAEVKGQKVACKLQVPVSFRLDN